MPPNHITALQHIISKKMKKKNNSKYYTDENVTRLIALQVIIILLLVLFTHQTYLIVILTLDFALRAFTYLPSPIALIAKITGNLLRLKPNYIFAAPKKFAAGIGFIFCIVISVLLYLNFITLTYAVSGILIFFALLESGFKICMGCNVYNWIVIPIANKINNKNRK